MFGKKVFLTGFFLGLFITHSVLGQSTGLNTAIDFSGLKSPIVLRGDSKNAYRDPAALYHAGFFVLVLSCQVHEVNVWKQKGRTV